MKLNLDALAVDTFPIDEPEPVIGKPKTYEPGCTRPELCPTGDTTITTP